MPRPPAGRLPSRGESRPSGADRSRVTCASAVDSSVTASLCAPPEAFPWPQPPQQLPPAVQRGQSQGMVPERDQPPPSLAAWARSPGCTDRPAAPRCRLRPPARAFTRARSRPARNPAGTAARRAPLPARRRAGRQRHCAERRPSSPSRYRTLPAAVDQVQTLLRADQQVLAIARERDGMHRRAHPVKTSQPQVSLRTCGPTSPA